MDYSQLSDFEINKRVAQCLGHSIDDQRYGFASIGVFHSDGITYKSYDYCNNPADAWPIIIQNSIGVIPYKKGLSEAWNTATGLINGTTKDANPLRAAMIVFLMMQENKNANS